MPTRKEETVTTLPISGNCSFPDGRKHNPRIVRNFSDDGKSFTDTASGEIGGASTDTVTQVFRKVSGNYHLSEDASEFKNLGDKLSNTMAPSFIYHPLLLASQKF